MCKIMNASQAFGAPPNMKKHHSDKFLMGKDER